MTVELVGPGLFQPALWHTLPVPLQPQLQLRLSSASFPQTASWPSPPGPSHSGSVSYAGAQNSALSFLKDHGALGVWGGRAQPLFSLNSTFSTWSPQLGVVYSPLVPPSLAFSSTSHLDANLPAGLGQGPFSVPQFPFLDKEEWGCNRSCYCHYKDILCMLAVTHQIIQQ